MLKFNLTFLFNLFKLVETKLSPFYFSGSSLPFLMTSAITQLLLSDMRSSKFKLSSRTFFCGSGRLVATITQLCAHRPVGTSGRILHYICSAKTISNCFAFLLRFLFFIFFVKKKKWIPSL